MSNKKAIRKAFRDATFKRDGYCCVMCDKKSSPQKAEEELDAHHITDRNEMPHGGYVQENGARLCKGCHELAEVFHSTSVSHPGYSPEDLYAKVGSSDMIAFRASLQLKLPVKKVEVDQGLVIQTEQMCNGANAHNLHTALAAYEGCARLWNETGIVTEKEKCVKAEIHLRKSVAKGVWEKF